MAYTENGVIKCVVCKVGQPATVEEVPYTWSSTSKKGMKSEQRHSSFQTLKKTIDCEMAVYGPFPFDDTLVVMCDEDGLPKGLPPNRIDYVGTFIVLARGKSGHQPLTAEQAQKTVEWLNTVTS